MDQEQFQPAAVSPSTAESERDSPNSAALEGNATPGEGQATEFSWDSDDNPYRSRASELEARAQAEERKRLEYEANVNRYFAQQSRQAEQVRRQTLQAQFENGDIDARTYSANLAEAVERQERESEQRIEQALRPYLAKDYADALAQQAGLSDDERKELHQAPPESMPWAVQAILQRRNYVPANEVQRLSSELDQLKRSLAAQRVDASGVNSTLGGNPSASGAKPVPGTVQDLRSFLQQNSPGLYQRRSG